MLINKKYEILKHFCVLPSSYIGIIVCLQLYFILQDSEKYVEELLTLFNRFSKLVKEAFSDDPRFLTARDKVCLAKIIVVRNDSRNITC